MKYKIYLSFFLTLFFFNAKANIIYVNEQANCASATGLSWEEAFCDLQEGLTLAESGDTIWIAQGTYFPTSGTNRDTSFHLIAGVAIYGGFVGTEITLAERDWEANQTILSGNIGDTTFWDNSYHVIIAENLDSTTVLDGLVIERGFAQDFEGNLANRIGAGIRYSVNTPAVTSWLRLTNVTLRHNRASGDNTDFRYGGSAINNQVTAGNLNIVLDNCSFENNIGKIPVMNTRTEDTSSVVNILMSNSAFTENANFSSLPFIIHNGVDSSSFDVTIDYCIFEANDGAIHNESFGGNLDLTINNSDFNNSLDDVLTIDYRGGTIDLTIDSSNFFSNQEKVVDVFMNSSMMNFLDGSKTELLVKISNSLFLENIDQSIDVRGGADTIYAAIKECRFEGNFANTGQSINIFTWNQTNFAWQPIETIIESCYFYNNEGNEMIAILDRKAKANTSVKNCIFEENKITATGFSALLIGIHDSQTKTVIENCQFIKNIELETFGLHVDSPALNIVFNNVLPVEIEVNYCSFLENKSFSTFASGAVSVEPRLVQENGSFSINFNDCLFYKNEGQRGGTIHNDYSFYSNFPTDESINFNNSLFYQNKGDQGAVAYVDNFTDAKMANLNFNNCTFFDNEAHASSGLFSNNSGKISGHNSIFWNNHKSDGTLPIPLVQSQDTNNTPPVNVFRNCLTQAGDENLPFTTYENMLYGIDPLFVDEANNDLNLQLCSPAISVGNNVYADSLLTDFAGNARIQSGNVDLGAYESPALDITTTTTAADCIADDGMIDFNILNGCEPYTLSWDNNASNNTNIDSLQAGAYSFTITDAVGKTEVVDPIIPVVPSDFVDAALTHYDCSESTAGTATITPTNDAIPYEYEWNTGTTDSLLTNLLPGIYQATVTDQNNCVDTLSVLIEPVENLPLNINLTPISCHDTTDGGAAIIPQSGFAPFSYQWASGQTDSLLTDLGGGAYSITVADAIDCQGELNFTILPPDPISLDILTENSLCFESNDGQIIVLASGGTGAFDYVWNTTQINDTISNLQPGFYTTTVTDEQGCTAGISTEITQPDEISLSIDLLNASSPTSADGAITVIETTGGTPPYQYLWDTGDTILVLNDLLSGFYTLTVTDSNNCEKITTYEVSFNSSSAEFENNQTAVILSPNPIYKEHYLNLHSENLNDKTVNISVWNTAGKAFKNNEKIHFNNGKSSIIAPIVSGLYIMKIELSNNKIMYLKFVVQ